MRSAPQKGWSALVVVLLALPVALHPGAAFAADPAGAVRALVDGPAAAPPFKVRTLTGEKLELKALIARGPVVLDFWATWCKPCLEALPELRRLHERYAERGVTVVGISEDGPRNYAKVRPFAASHKLRYPIVLDEDGALQALYQVRALPTTFVIDRAGRIVRVEQGYRPGFSVALEEALESALADSVPGTGE